MSSATADCSSSSSSGVGSAEQLLSGSWIVEPSTVLATEQLDVEEWTWEGLAEEVKDHRSLLRFLARRNVIQNNLQCASCERPANLYNWKSRSDKYVWRCNGCKKKWSIRTGRDLLSSNRGSLLEHVSVFYRLFQLPSAGKLDDLSRLSNHVVGELVSNTIVQGNKWLEKNVMLGGALAVFIDLYTPEWFSGTFFLAVEELTNLTVTVIIPARTVENVRRQLEKWCAPGSTVVLKHSSIDGSSLDRSRYEYVNVDGQSVRSEELKEGYNDAIASFARDVERTKFRLTSIGSKRVDIRIDQIVLVVPLQRYYFYISQTTQPCIHVDASSAVSTPTVAT
eukprot:scpid74917/ scgid26979/ 